MPYSLLKRNLNKTLQMQTPSSQPCFLFQSHRHPRVDGRGLCTFSIYVSGKYPHILDFITENKHTASFFSQWL